MKALEQVLRGEIPSVSDLAQLIEKADDRILESLRRAAVLKTQESFGRGIYIRGLLEVSNICKNDCYYCGIRRSNKSLARYRLSTDQVLASAAKGAALGFQTLVIQGGEDPGLTDDLVCDWIRQIKAAHPDMAITLSLGERSDASYALLKAAGADRYLLRHETISQAHYASLHPKEMKLSNRIRCLKSLKALGYQVGCGMMVGSPGQRPADLARDLIFMARFNPEMVGMGPFLPQEATPFRDQAKGRLDQTLLCLAITRLLLPQTLLPATTALGTLAENGRLEGILSGANVCMPNLSPAENRDNYALYDNKLATGLENAESLDDLDASFQTIGYHIDYGRGDAAGFQKEG